MPLLRAREDLVQALSVLLQDSDSCRAGVGGRQGMPLLRAKRLGAGAMCAVRQDCDSYRAGCRRKARHALVTSDKAWCRRNVCC